MKLFALAPLSMLLVGAAPPIDEVPVGVFRLWGIRPAVPLQFTSGEIEISVVAQPCPAKPQTEGCRFEGINNQATITVAAPGLPPFSMSSDRQASFVRVAAVRLDERDPRLGVVVDNQWGGSAGLTAVTVIEPIEGGYRAVPIQRRGERELEGEVGDNPRDVTGDGRVDLVLTDPAFDSPFDCNACSPRPPVIVSVIDGRSVDLSALPAARPVFAREIIGVRTMCRSSHGNRNGNCVAYLADAARLGRFDAAWRDMLSHYDRHSQWPLWQDCTAPRTSHNRCPPGAATQYRTFPEAVRAFLVRTGYISPAQAAAAPLS